MEENALKPKEKRDEKGLFLPGTTPGPGRPKGKTIKERVKDYLENHPEDMEKFVEHFVKTNRDLAWQMLEGRPTQGIGQAEDLPPLILTTYGNPKPIPTEDVPNTTP